MLIILLGLWQLSLEQISHPHREQPGLKSEILTIDIVTADQGQFRRCLNTQGVHKGSLQFRRLITKAIDKMF